jgi:hypothetical protein
VVFLFPASALRSVGARGCVFLLSFWNLETALAGGALDGLAEEFWGNVEIGVAVGTGD